jgi:hypothetical protein
MDLAKGTNQNRQTAQEFSVGPYALLNFEPHSILSLNTGLRYDAPFVGGKSHEWTTAGMPVTYPEDEKSTNWGSLRQTSNWKRDGPLRRPGA